jgi:CRP-like cAMP-binding protein
MGVGQPGNRSRWPLYAPGRNNLLSALPVRDRERIMTQCDKRVFESGEVLYEPNVPGTHGYFPLSGLISLVMKSDDGAGIEVGITGNEGFGGLQLVLGAGQSPVRAVCQAPGTFLSISLAVLKRELESSSAMRDLLGRYTQTVMTQMSQSVLCNNEHAMEQRLCRWLLAAHDRLDMDDLPLTHTLLAQMLGVRRPSVTVAAGMLKKAGLVDYSRGNITVLDRAALEAASCECYAVIRAEFERLLTKQQE